MKKRLLAWLLAVVMVIGLLPGVALATETTEEGGTTQSTDPVVTLDTENNMIVVNGTSYNVYLGQGTQNGDRISGSAQGFTSALISSEDQVTFDGYLVFADRSNGGWAEADEAVYNAVWDSCDFTVTAVNGVNWGTLTTASDGYHKYFPITITGICAGVLSVSVKLKDDNTATVSCQGKFEVGLAEKLELTNGQATFSFEGAFGSTKSYYIDLDSTQTVQISAALTSPDARGKITANGISSPLWVYYVDGTGAMSNPSTFTGNKILLTVQSYTAGTVTGTINVEVEQPKLMYRSMSYNGSVWTENSTFYDLSTVTVGLGQIWRMRLYYGTSTNAQCLTGGTFTSSDSGIANVRENGASAPSADGNPFYFVCASEKLGCAQITYTTADNTAYSFQVDVTLPSRGFYSAGERSEANYLSMVDLNGVNAGLTSIWYISEYSMASEKENITVKAGDTKVTGCKWVDDYTLEISLPTDITSGSYELTVYNGASRLCGIRVTPPEQPQLLFRDLIYANGVWTENTVFNELNTISLELGRHRRMRLYYGTSAVSLSLTGGTLTSSDPNTVSVRINNESEPSSDGNPFYVITAEQIGSATVTYTASDGTEYLFQVNVTLPYYGFYSLGERNDANYLSSVSLTGEETDSSVWFISENSMEDIKTNIIVKAGDTDITSNCSWAADNCKFEITLPTDITSGSYELAVYNGENKLRGIKVAQSGGNTSTNQPVKPEAPALPEGVSPVNFYDSQTRDLNDYLTYVYWRNLQEGEGDYRTLWYMSEDGFTADEQATITVTVADEVYTPVWVERNSGIYDLKILLPQPEKNAASYGRYYAPYNVVVYKDDTPISGIHVDYRLEGANQVIDGVTISFAQISESGAVAVDLNVLGGQGNGAFSYDGNYYHRTNATLVAASLNDEGGWVVNEEVTNSLRVTEWKIVNINGTPSTFSWSAASHVDTLTRNSPRSIPLYVKSGSVAQSMVEAKVTGTINGETFSTTITGGLYVYFVAGGADETRPAGDTVEELNEFLQTLAGNVDPTVVQGTCYKVTLASTTYDGTILIPSEFRNTNFLHLYGAKDGGTIIKGGINLNTASVEILNGIHFVSNDTEGVQTCALYGSGVRTMTNCSFYGYDVAVNCSNGSINAKGGNVFVNNEIAVLVDLENATPNDEMSHNLSYDEWFGNTFINNTIAMQVISLHKKISTYYFRICDSNFINNGTDIDAWCGGTLYMYRNYFGQYKEDKENGIYRPIPGKHHAGRHNGRDDLRLGDLQNARTLTKLGDILDLELASAKISTANNTKVITNPRWRHPIKGWWAHYVAINDVFFLEEVSASATALMTLSLEEESEYEDILVSDWSSETTILNEESGNLLLDASAFTMVTEESKTIEVLDTEEQTLGTWSFPNVSTFFLRSTSAAETGSFNAGLSVDRSVAGQIYVTVLESEVLTSKMPILSIPCGQRGTVTFGGEEIESFSENGQISFQVTQAGTYVITLESLTAEYNADAGTVTLSNVQEGMIVVLAAYKEGKMVYTNMQVMQAGDALFTFELPTDLTADTIRLFFLTSEWQPADTYKSWSEE